MIQETIIGDLKKNGFGLISVIKRLSQRYKCKLRGFPGIPLAPLAPRIY